MFGFLGNRKLNNARKQGKEWYQLARKIDHFRRDVVSEEGLLELRKAYGALHAVLKDKGATVADISAAVEALEPILRRLGGDFYPRNSVTEYVDMIVVAAIFMIGIRTFFLQPFKIPTNSMYPTYNGLTTEVYFGDEEPGRAMRLFRVAQLGAGHRTVKGEAGKELIIPVLTSPPSPQTRGYFTRGMQRGFIPANYQASAGFQRFLVLPGPAFDYTFLVGDEPVYVRVPAEFPMNHVLKKILDRAGDDLRVERGSGGYDFLVHTGIRVPDDGSPVLSFDVKSGDMLFVDRFTYNFRRPQVGDPFVFNTTTIKTMEQDQRGMYYIKRIAGGPGDVLKVEEPVLYRNGKPADGAEAFLRNARREGEYEGYLPRIGRNQRALNFEQTIPDDSYFAMGDNSDESADSRSWGFVPEKAIVGRAIFIYYPFSSRWGLAE